MLYVSVRATCRRQAARRWTTKKKRRKKEKEKENKRQKHWMRLKLQALNHLETAACRLRPSSARLGWASVSMWQLSTTRSHRAPAWASTQTTAASLAAAGRGRPTRLPCRRGAASCCEGVAGAHARRWPLRVSGNETVLCVLL